MPKLLASVTRPFPTPAASAQANTPAQSRRPRRNRNRRDASTAPPVDAEGHQWWQHAVFYEIYPRSYADSNNDGIGDLPGIDFQARLPEDASASTPSGSRPASRRRKSISDTTSPTTKTSIPCTARSPTSTRCRRDAQGRDIRIILDFVMNHTSDQNKWFIDSRSSRTSKHRDWYIWRDGKGPNQPPNNWLSTFGGSAWQFDGKTRQYYYHYLLSAAARP